MSRERLPPPVQADLTDTVRDYWLARAAQHEFDWYAGVRLPKFPEDLELYGMSCHPSGFLQRTQASA